MDKAGLVAWLKLQDQHWQALLLEIGPGRLEQPGVSGVWSMKDIIAHLTGWNVHFAERFRAAMRGEPEPPSPWGSDLKGDDAINAWIIKAYRGRALQDVLDETDRVNGEILALVRELPDDIRIEHIEPEFYLVWLGEKRYEVGEFYDHFRDDHESEVRTWLAQQNGVRRRGAVEIP